jgi:hypothetical protein
MLGNFILETANAPGQATVVNLAGAVAGRRPFSSRFANGANAFVFLDDGTQAEASFGPVTVGSPNSVSRSFVVWNTAGTTARLNFSGAVRVYNEVPAERVAYFDDNNVLTTTNRAINAGTGGITAGDITSAGNLQINTAVGQFAALTMRTAGNARWIAGKDGADDYRIGRYDNAGNVTDYPIAISRTTGKVTLTSTLAVAAAAAASDAVNLGQFATGAGWMRIPVSGDVPVLLQWGSANGAGATTGVTNFKVNFPNAAAYVGLTPTPNQSALWLSSFNPAGFGWGANPGSAFYWHAIGN